VRAVFKKHLFLSIFMAVTSHPFARVHQIHRQHTPEYQPSMPTKPSELTKSYTVFLYFN